jgi:hypothetical protein
LYEEKFALHVAWNGMKKANRSGVVKGKFESHVAFGTAATVYTQVVTLLRTFVSPIQFSFLSQSSQFVSFIMMYARLLLVVLLGVSVLGETELKHRQLQPGDPGDPMGDGPMGDEPTASPADDGPPPTGEEPTASPMASPTDDPPEPAGPGDETDVPVGADTESPASETEVPADDGDTESPTESPTVEVAASSAFSLKTSAMVLVPAVACFFI